MRLEMMMVAKRGKLGKGGFQLHGTGMRHGSIRRAMRFADGTMCWAVRFDSLDRRVGTAGGDGCALRFRALQVLRSGHSWELLLPERDCPWELVD